MPRLRHNDDKATVASRQPVQLVTHPNPLLRTRSSPVGRVGKNEHRLLRQMLKHMRRWKSVGLAAPQVGRLEQLIVADVGDHTVLWANPTILEPCGTQHMEEEGCLSIPGTRVDVIRPIHIWVQALDEYNKKVESKLEGLLARVIQHEIDHLHGVLIIDHGPPVLGAASSKPGNVE